MTVRATARGAQRTSLDGTHVDVLICGASFGGLAVARELAGCGADVLVVDRYEIGERQTSACAIPTPWLDALDLRAAARQELPRMTFTTPHGSVAYRLPWSWTAFDYRELCGELWRQCGDAQFVTAKIDGRAADDDDDVVVRSDRGLLRARFVVDALGWRRVLAEPHHQPPDSPLSRGLEIHAAREPAGDALDIWVERGLVRRGYGWRVPAGDEARIGVASYDPRRQVKQPAVALAERSGAEPERFQGNWFPHRLRPAADDGVFYVGDSAGHCYPLSGEGIRPALYFGIACGREIAASLAGERPRAAALARYRDFSHAHRRGFRLALRLQRLIPALPPRLLLAVLRIIGRQSLVDRAFGWYIGLTPVPTESRDARIAVRVP